jgi:flagellar assembly protein FliH
MGNAQNSPDKNLKKFFFDLHDFEAPEVHPEETPPPVTYSQEELDAAKQLAHDQGRQKGLNEAAASREQKVTQLVQQISTQFATLFASEQERESRYEEEVIGLVIQSLDKLFPSLNERIGPYEMQQAVSRILKSASDQSEITIRVAPEFTADIESVIAPIRNKDINPPNFHIVADETLDDGECRLQWSDGGAVRNAARLSAEIYDALLSLLPAAPSPPAAPESDVSAEGTDSVNDDINEKIDTESHESDPAPQDSGDTHE